MNLHDSFDFGKYIGLSPIEVYSGTSDIDKKLSADFIHYCLNQLKGDISFDEFEFIDEFFVDEDIIYVIPCIANEDKLPSKSNRILFEDLSNQIQSFVNQFILNKFDKNTEFESFNNNYYNKVIGGNPEYLEWISMEKHIFSSAQLSNLEHMEVNRLKGINVRKIEKNKYRFSWFFMKERYNFKQETYDKISKWDEIIGYGKETFEVSENFYYILVESINFAYEGNIRSHLTFERLQSKEIALKIAESLSPPDLLDLGCMIILTNDISLYKIFGCYNIGFFKELIINSDYSSYQQEILIHIEQLSHGKINSFAPILECTEYDYGDVYFYKGVATNLNFDHFSLNRKIKDYLSKEFTNQNKIPELRESSASDNYINWRDLKFVRIGDKYICHYSNELRIKVQNKLTLIVLQRFYNFKYITFDSVVSNYKYTFKFYIELNLRINFDMFKNVPVLLEYLFPKYDFEIEELRGNIKCSIHNENETKFVIEKRLIDRFFKHNVYKVDDNKEIKLYQENDFKPF